MRWVPLALFLSAAALGAAAPPPARYRDDRMAAWHQTLAAVNEVRPNAGVLTYVNDRFTQTDAYGLAKLVVGVGAGPGGAVLWADAAEAVDVRDLPGGVRCRYRLGGVGVETELVPLLVGHDPPDWAGAAWFRVATDPPRPVTVRCGGSVVTGMFGTSRAGWLQAAGVGSVADTATVADGGGLLRSTLHPLAVAIQAATPAEVEPGDAGGTRLVLRFPAGSGWVMLGFGRDEATARAKAALDPDAERAAVDRHYRWLLSSRIETPVPDLDAAFTHAIRTLEYNWVAPHGWTECIHHWYSLWHMQHSPAAEWLGQEARSRQCLLSHAAALLPNGAVPQLSPGSGRVHRDFGGSNQFHLWQVRHYWRQTGDRDTVRVLAPALDSILRQTWDEYDRDGDGLLAWGQQIGNQEDYVSTPGDGTSPTIEGVQMLRTRAEVARALGDEATATACDRRTAELLARLRRELWLPELGRFAFYRDPLGVVRPDGQYHTLLYPALWEVVDPLDAWTTLRQLRDRLTGPGGEVYCSSNFPWHAVGTWGMQAGAAQQPWAAMGLAHLGRWNETHRPLETAALPRRVSA
ncbi:MAG: hypothetical protein HYU66_15260 [Armatimonadetes bacterium]|nr:hypothetical protein [Armatimonadota bacterium]